MSTTAQYPVLPLAAGTLARVFAAFLAPVVATSKLVARAIRNRHDAKLLSDTVGVAFMPSRCLPLASLGRLVGTVRGSTRKNADVTVIATFGLTVEPLGSGRLINLVLLCRTDTSIPALKQQAVDEAGKQ